MIVFVNTSLMLALRCPVCGSVEFNSLSRFELARGEAVELECSCGNPLFKAISFNNKQYHFSLECSACLERHAFEYSGRELWSKDLHAFICKRTGLEIGFIGTLEKTKKAGLRLRSELRKTAEEVDCADFFESPDIIYRILEHLQKLAKDNLLRCECHNSALDIEAFPERIDLICGRCGAVGIVFAQEFKDLLFVSGLKKIILSQGKYSYFSEEKKSRKTSGKDKFD